LNRALSFFLSTIPRKHFAVVVRKNRSPTSPSYASRGAAVTRRVKFVGTGAGQQRSRIDAEIFIFAERGFNTSGAAPPAILIALVCPKVLEKLAVWLYASTANFVDDREDT
jgi:hypothetical protein